MTESENTKKFITIDLKELKIDDIVQISIDGEITYQLIARQDPRASTLKLRLEPTLSFVEAASGKTWIMRKQ